MSYQLKIDPKSRRAARFISQLQKKIHSVLVESGKTQQQVAEILGVDRSVVNRRLKGNANLTARSIAEFAYAFDKKIILEFGDKNRAERTNRTESTDNVTTLQNMAQAPSTGTNGPIPKFNVESTAA